MKIRSTIFLVVVISFAFVGCAPRYPVTTVNTLDTRPTLSFKGAPEGAVISVDGLNMGKAAKYTGRSTALVVEPGTHELQIIQGGEVIFKQTIFIESEHKVINVH
ncbi:MAG: hypothetical protein KBD53_12180 [Candidatus Omnitrophica bacterium]|nr:hypothetical protein [Candidatus Omnitrophota bacterium]